MKKYETVPISERQLEDLIRHAGHLLEDGLSYIDHQLATAGGRLDVLFGDSGHALVVAELKVTEDELILNQALDYYDYVYTNLEAFARLYKSFHVDPTQKPRLFLVAPGFSSSLLNRCKWVNVPLSLFAFKCIRFEGEPEVLPVFSEVTLPSLPESVRVHTVDDRINYITVDDVKNKVRAFIDEVRDWDTDKITIEATALGSKFQV